MTSIEELEQKIKNTNQQLFKEYCKMSFLQGKLYQLDPLNQLNFEVWFDSHPELHDKEIK